MVLPDFIKNISEGLVKHEKSFDSILGKENVTILAPEKFIINENYWNQFKPDQKTKVGIISNGVKDYKYIGKETIYISYDLEPKPSQRPDLRNLSDCPHPNCVYCLQIKKLSTQFENGIYRSLKVGESFSFSANANLMQATLWVEQGKAKIITYEGSSEFMRSEIIDAYKPTTVWTYGRRELRTIRVFAVAEENSSTKNGITRVWCHINRYTIENWP
jgi:hypothetical protein